MSAPETPRDLWTDEDFIAAYGERARKMAWPLSLGPLQRPGWKGTIKTYLLWCPRCRLTPSRGFTVTSLAGHAGRLHCGYCKARYDHLLPSRRLKGALLNPFSSPRMILLLLLVALLVAIAASRP